jgi:hypothetical protein
MRDNFPKYEIDLKIKTDIAGFFACYKKYFAPDEKKPPRPGPDAAVCDASTLA